MAKIAMIGAGSLVFCKTLMSDFLATPALAGSEFRQDYEIPLDPALAIANRFMKLAGVQ